MLLLLLLLLMPCCCPNATPSTQSTKGCFFFFLPHSRLTQSLLLSLVLVLVTMGRKVNAETRQLHYKEST
jgi:hypothetical protein